MTTPKEQDEKIKEIIGRQLDKIDDKEMFSVEECMREYGEYILTSATQKGREDVLQKILKMKKPMLGKDQYGTELYEAGTGNMQYNQVIDEIVSSFTE